MAGRGRVQIGRSVRAAGQPRHRVPLPLLLLHTAAATFFKLCEIPAVAAFSVRLRRHDDLLLHTGTTFSVLLQRHGNLLLHAVAASSLRINAHQPATSSFLSNSTALLVPCALEEQWAISRTDIPSNHLTKYQTWLAIV
ncbi:hypothetical protein EJB05_31994, partial [Eragrostis curvula]